jgi:hypothetical protein
MMIVSDSSAKRRHAILWFVALFLFGAPGPLFTANFSWPPRDKKPKGM